MIVMWLVAAVLFSQWLLPAKQVAASLPARAPLAECAAANCTCCAGHPKGAKCCCTAETHAAELASVERSEPAFCAPACGSGDSGPSFFVLKCETVLPDNLGFEPPAATSQTVVGLRRMPVSRVRAPLDPPPETPAHSA
ncbi:MAG: hypothetical protein PCFJNLEI_02271 [Verrucomicrobiae bacterium]|nr:hypothetical protein [Verrucomicrobiae bacterium]